MVRRMGASASLQATELRVAPGGEVTTELRVRNTGTVVDQFTFHPLGSAASWMVIEPAQVSLFPGAEETVQVIFRPPRIATTPSGPTAFAVRAESREDPEGSAVEEGVVHVEPFDERTVEVVPHTTRGRRKGRADVAVDNRGNTKANIQLTGIDPDGALEFDFSPPALAVEPGAAAFSKVTITPKDRFWRGPSVTKQYQVLAEEESKEPIAADGALLQDSMLPPWLWKAVLAALLGLLALILLWFLLFRPSIESTAKDAVEEEIAPINAALEQNNITTVATTPDGGTVAPPGGGATTVAPPGGGGTTVAPPGGDVLGDRSPFDTRLVAVAPANAGGEPASFAVPNDQFLELTDIVLQNPNGDSGRIVISRDGSPILVSALENFRDLDYHFVSPYVFDSGSNLTVQITSCTNPATACEAAVSFSGFLRPSS